MNKVEKLILKNLLLNEAYVRKTLPFLKLEYFSDFLEKSLFSVISKYFTQYKALPTKEALEIEVGQIDTISDEQHQSIVGIIRDIDDEESDPDWILDTTEKWCKERAIYLALMESIKIAEGNDDKQTPSAIPNILSDALAVSFDNNIGHDYLQDYEERYDFYHRTEEKIPFDLEFFNKITKGGIPNKTLNIALAGTGVGKSLFMCHVASSCLLQGKDVLYITLEMAEEKIAERIDSNLLNCDIQQLNQLPKMMFDNKITALSKKTEGKLIVKEYPTASAHAGHFRSLLNELALKKSFKPDIIFNLSDIIKGSSIGVKMNQLRKIRFLIYAMPIFSGNLMAAELIMVEQQGCYYCLEWKDQLGNIYPKTPEGKYAPLKTIDITEVDELEGLQRDVIFTPTFVLMENDRELGRLEGYSSEDFFWELLEVILEKETEYTAPKVVKTIN